MTRLRFLLVSLFAAVAACLGVRRMRDYREIAIAAGWVEHPPERPGVSTYWMHDDSDTIVFKWTLGSMAHTGLIDRKHCGCYDCRKSA